MVKKYVILAIACSCLHASTERYEIDSIKVIIYGESDTIIITESEVVRPGLDGQPKTADDLIFENLVYLDAKRIGAIPSPEDIRRHWEEVKNQNGLSEADMQNIAAQSGYTLQEAKGQLGKMSSINSMFDFKVRSGLFVSKREVECYYNEHPEVEQAEYLICCAVVPFSDLEPKDQQKKRLETYARTGKGSRIAWSTPFWVKHNEVLQEKRFVYQMKIGHISQPVETPYGFEMIKLVEKKPERLVPLQERYDAIANHLKRPKYQVCLENYKQELFNKATIVYY